MEGKREAMKQVAKAAFPRVAEQDIQRDPVAVMLRETQSLRTLAGKPGDNDLESLLQAAASAWPSDQPAVENLRFEQPGSWVVNMDLSRDGSWLATASQDGHVFIIDRHDLSKPPVATVSDDTPLQVVLFDPTQPHRVFTLGRSDIAPKLWSWGVDGNVERLPKYQTPPLPTFGLLVSLAVSPDGKTIAAGDNGGSVHLWDTRTGTLRTDRALPGIGQPADSVTFDPTGQLLAATGRGGIRLWKWDTAERPIPLSHPHATNVTFDPSGDHLASTAGDGTVNVWTPRRGVPGGAPRYTVSNCSPTTWKLHGWVGPALTTQNRTRSPSFTRMGSLMY